MPDRNDRKASDPALPGEKRVSISAVDFLRLVLEMGRLFEKALFVARRLSGQPRYS